MSTIQAITMNNVRRAFWMRRALRSKMLVQNQCFNDVVWC